MVGGAIVLDGFDLRSDNPLDIKYIVPDLASLATLQFKHKGMQRFVVAKNRVYILQGDLVTWKPSAKGSGIERWVAGTYDQYDLVIKSGKIYESQVDANAVVPGTDNTKWLDTSGSALSVDDTPTTNSNNLVKSGGVAAADVNTLQAAKDYTDGKKDANGWFAGLTGFKINFFNGLGTFKSFFTNNNTAARTYTFKDRDGIIADNTDLAAKANVSDSLTVTPAQLAALTAGQTYFLSLIKDAVSGLPQLNTSVRSVNIIAPSTVNTPLLTATTWGNIAGMGTEYTKLTGDNTNGALGVRGQLTVLNGNIYVCTNHEVGTTTANGTATWARNKSVNFLDSTDVSDSALITQLTAEAGWTADQFLATTNPSTKGTTYAGLTGYFYICIDKNSWRRYQIAPFAKAMQITTGSHPVLTAHLQAYTTFTTTGNYIEVGTDEVCVMGQEYWPAGKSYYFKRGSTAQGWIIIQKNIINPS